MTLQSIRPMHLQFLSVAMRIPPKIDHIFEVALRLLSLQEQKYKVGVLRYMFHV